MAAALFGPDPVKIGIHGAFWFLAKVGGYVYAFLWVRFTFPRYRFDQLMRLGWRFLIPLALVNVIVVGSGMIVQENWGWRHPLLSAIVTTLIMLGVAVFLAYDDEKHQAAVQAAGGE
jgi:NADH dehydrogenase